MKYAHYDEQTGEVKGYYADDVHDVIPTPNIELTEEAWQEACSKHMRVVDGVLEEIPPTPPTYAESRVMEYPSIGDQLDALFHAGVFPAEMAAQIQAVKDKYPKV